MNDNLTNEVLITFWQGAGTKLLKKHMFRSVFPEI